MARLAGCFDRVVKVDQGVTSPSLSLVLGFWIVTNVTTIVWWRLELSDRYLPGNLHFLGVAAFVLFALSPIGLLLVIRRSFLNPLTLGLLVSCCLALSITAHEANLLRDQMQFSLDHEREFAYSSYVEGIIRPLISKIVEVYVQFMGDGRFKGTAFQTHIAINYMFDSLSFLAVFALATHLLPPASGWLCLLGFAFYTQIAIFPGRMGAVFLAGGLCWQLFLLVSRRYPAAIISGLIISFARTDVVFASAFALLSLPAFERRWPTTRECTVFAVLIGISVITPELLLWMHPDANFKSFLITQGDYFGKILGNLASMKLAVAIASPMLAIAIVGACSITRTVAVVVPAALVHVGIVFLIADFSETRLIVPALGALTFVACEALGRLIGTDCQPNPAA